MTTELYLASEQAIHTPQVEALNDKLFGLDRHTKTVARFRDGVDPIAPLCLVALNRADQRVKGSIRYWPVKVGSTELIMLGPVCVDTGWQGKGIAGALISTSLEIAALHGHSGVILKCNSEDKFAVYAKHGFSCEAASGLVLPGPKKKSRAESKLLMALDLVPGTLSDLSGVITKAETLRAPPVVTALHSGLHTEYQAYPVLQTA